MTNKQRLWSQADIVYLIKHYPDTPTKDLALKLNCSTRRIYAKSAALGLKKSIAFMNSSASGRTTGNQGLHTRFKKAIYLGIKVILAPQGITLQAVKLNLKRAAPLSTLCPSVATELMHKARCNAKLITILAVTASDGVVCMSSSGSKPTDHYHLNTLLDLSQACAPRCSKKSPSIRSSASASLKTCDVIPYTVIPKKLLTLSVLVQY